MGFGGLGRMAGRRGWSCDGADAFARESKDACVEAADSVLRDWF